MILRSALRALVVFFPVSEIALLLARRARAGVARRADGGSTALMWLVILLSLGVAIASQWSPGPIVPGPRVVLRALALTFLASGLALRWTAVLTLGRFFTVDVAIHDGHAVVNRGVYRYVRHPSYAGLLAAFAGLALDFGNWISVGALTVPIVLVVLVRIRREETALRSALGASYDTYCSTTKRLVPGVY